MKNPFLISGKLNRFILGPTKRIAVKWYIFDIMLWHLVHQDFAAIKLIFHESLKHHGRKGIEERPPAANKLDVEME